MLHNYTKHKNSKMFAVAYSSVGEAIDHIEVTEVNEKKAIDEFEQRMGIFPFGYYVIFTKTAPYYYNLGGGVGNYKMVAFPEDKTYKYYVVDEDENNYLTVQENKFDKWKNADKFDRKEYYSELIPKSEMVEIDKMAESGSNIQLKPKRREMTNVSNEVYIEFLNKEKGYQKDVKHFKSYEQAVNWARKNFDKFSPDMIKHKMAGGGGIGDFTIDNGGNYENSQGYELINQFNGTYQVLNPKGNDIAGVFETFEQAKKTVANWEKGQVMFKNGGGVGMAKDGLLIGDLRKELNRINSNIIELEEELKSPDVSDYRINQIEVVLLPDLEYGRSLYLSTLKNKLNRRYLETGKAIKEDLPLMNSKKEEYIIHGKGFKNGGGVGSDDSILNLFKKNKINKNSKEAYEEWENEVIEVIEYNENINRSQAQEIVDAKEFEMAHSWSNNTPAFNTAQVILGKRLVSSGRSNPFDYKGKTDKIREITKEMREIAREINPTKREVRREVRMELP